MNYKVLYRKYRPSDFENIVGQEYILKTLKNSIISNSISHAYIFSGPRGTGKTSTARVFAKAINCVNNSSGTPCNNCEFCLNFSENPDIIEIDAASHNGVDQIRELIENVKLTPTNGKFKVYIIDEVHMLTTSAFNALLLTLEEPPSHIVFIFATTNIENVPITILSRCQRYDFKKISIDDITARLKEICEKENIEINSEALQEIAELSEGGMRDALSLLDQLSKNNELITLEMVEKQVKTIANSSIKELIKYIDRNDIDSIMNFISDIELKGVDYKTFVKKMINVLTAKAISIKKSQRSERLNYDDYKKMVNTLVNLMNNNNINIKPYNILLLELLSFVDEPLAKSKSISESEVIKEDEIKINSSPLSNVEPAHRKLDNNLDKIIEIRVNNCFVNAKKVYLDDMKNKIKKIIDNLEGAKKIRNILLDTVLVAASDEYLIFSSDNNHVAMNYNENLKKIEEELYNLLLIKYKIIFISSSRWQTEKLSYVNNLKNNKKYIIIEEKELLTKNSEIEKLADDLFDKNKLEII